MAAGVISKVKLTNFEASERIIGEVTSFLSNEVQKDSTINAEQSSRCCGKFEEVFRRIVKANTKCNRQTALSDGVCDQECESNDGACALQEEFNAVLYPQLTSAVVKVARKRKTYPPMCRQRIMRGLQSQMEDMRSEVGRAREFTTTSQPTTNPHPNNEELLRLAHCSSADLSTFKKNANRVTKQAGRLKLAQMQRKKNRGLSKIEER